MSPISRQSLAHLRSPTVGLLTGVAVLIVVLWAPLDIDPRAQGSLAVFLFAISLWLTKPLPLSVVSVLSIVLLTVIGVTDTFAAAATGFATRLVFFLFLLLVLGRAIAKVDIDAYVAARLLSASSTPRQSFWLLARNILLLALLMPSGIARTVTFVPVVEQLTERYGVDPTASFQSSSLLVLGQLNPIASLMIMTGGGMAILSSELIRTVTPISWLEWFLYMAPPVVLVYVLGAITVSRLYPIPEGRYHEVDGRAAANGGDWITDGDDADRTIELSPEQRIVGGVMAVTILLWALGSITGISSIVPPLLAVCVLAAPGIDIVTADDVQAVNWDVLFLFGGVFSLTKVMEDTGAISVVVDTLLSVVPLQVLTEPVAVVTILGFVLVVRLFFSTASACLAVTLPVTLSLSSVVGVDTLSLALSTVIVVGAATLLPFHQPTALLVIEAHETPTPKDVFVLGAATLLYASVAITLAWTMYWPLLG